MTTETVRVRTRPTWLCVPEGMDTYPLPAGDHRCGSEFDVTPEQAERLVEQGHVEIVEE